MRPAAPATQQHVKHGYHARSLGTRNIPSLARPSTQPISRTAAMVAPRQPGTSRPAMVLHQDGRPMVKFQEYCREEGPVAGPSNEVFLTANEVAAQDVARRRERARDWEEWRLEEEARR